MLKRCLGSAVIFALSLTLTQVPARAQYAVEQADPALQQRLGELSQRTADTVMAVQEDDYPQRLVYLVQDMQQFGEMGSDVVSQTLTNMVASSPWMTGPAQQVANDINQRVYAPAVAQPAPPTVFFAERHEHPHRDHWDHDEDREWHGSPVWQERGGSHRHDDDRQAGAAPQQQPARLQPPPPPHTPGPVQIQVPRHDWPRPQAQPTRFQPSAPAQGQPVRLPPPAPPPPSPRPPAQGQPVRLPPPAPPPSPPPHQEHPHGPEGGHGHQHEQHRCDPQHEHCEGH